MVSSDKKRAIIEEFRASENDTGSSAVQIALLHEHIQHISKHLQKFKKDKHSRLGLIKLVGQKNRLIRYLKRKDLEKYNTVMRALKSSS